MLESHFGRRRGSGNDWLVVIVVAAAEDAAVATAVLNADAGR